jgi:rubrerythrin
VSEITEALEKFKERNPLPEVWQCPICGAVTKAAALRNYEPNTHCVHPSSWFGTEYDISCEMIKMKPIII